MEVNKVSGVRTSYHPAARLASWTRLNLRQDLFIQDLDLVIRDRKGNLMILEVKARKANVSKCQHTTLSMFNILLNKLGNSNIDLPVGRAVVDTCFKWHGVHLLQFEKDEADFNGKVWLDNEEINEVELIAILNFDMDITLWKQSKEAGSVTDENLM